MVKMLIYVYPQVYPYMCITVCIPVFVCCLYVLGTDSFHLRICPQADCQTIKMFLHWIRLMLGMYICRYIYIHTYKYTYICVCARVCVCVCVVYVYHLSSIHPPIHTHTYAHTHTHTSAHTYTHIHTHIHTHTYIHSYIRKYIGDTWTNEIFITLPMTNNWYSASGCRPAITAGMNGTFARTKVWVSSNTVIVGTS